MFFRCIFALIKLNKALLFILVSSFFINQSFGQSCDCISPPDCNPCEGNLTSITLKYNGPTGPPNRYRVRDDGGQLANEVIAEEITINSRAEGQPFEGNRLVISINVGGGFGDGIEIHTNCNEIKLGQEYDNGNLTVISAISSNSGIICCAPEDSDEIPPEIANCPTDVVLLANSNCEATYSWTEPTVADNCGFATFIEEPESTSGTFPIGENLIKYVAADSNGNVSVCEFIITVELETELAIYDCPSDIEVLAKNSCSSTVEWQEPTVTDSCNTISLESNYKPGDSFPIGTTEVIYTAKDSNGSEVTCSFIVNVINPFEPEISDCPSDISFEIIEEESVAVEWEEPLLEWACVSQNLKSNYKSGDRFSPGETEVVYSYFLENEEVIACSFFVTIISKQIEINIPEILTINNDGINDEWKLEGIEQFSENEVVILDRWGGEIFKTTDYNNEEKIWSGENKRGNLVPTGTYYYIIKAVSGSKIIEKSGFIELIR